MAEPTQLGARLYLLADPGTFPRTAPDAAELARYLVHARRQAYYPDGPTRDAGGIPMGEFVATLSDDERRILRTVIDAELARRAAETGGAIEAVTAPR